MKIEIMGVNEDIPISKVIMALNVDKQALAAPVKSVVDKFQLLPEFLKVRGLVKQHLDSFNYFVRTQIKQIVRANDLITSKIDPSIYLRYKDVRIGEPSIIIDGVTEKLTPHKCRLSDLTYAAPIYVNIEYITGSHGSKTTQMKRDVIIGRMPIMLRSCCCVLYGKDEEELARCGECPLDPGGYFVIKGTEKVILIQEQLSKNRIIIDTDKKSCVQASVTSSTETTKSKTVIKMEKEKIYLYLNLFTSKVPIMIVMKAMGMESDQEVVQMIGRDPRYSELLLPSIEDCAKEAVYTQYQALEYLEQKVKKLPYSTALIEKEGRALGILRDIFLANIPVHQDNFRPKCIYVAVMLRRMMEAILNKDAMDDKVDNCKDRIASALETLKPTTSWERTTTAGQGLDGVLLGERGFGVAMEAILNYLGSEYGNTYALGVVILASLEKGIREGRMLLHDWLVILTAQYNDACKIAQYQGGSLTTADIDVAFSQCPHLQPLPRLVFALLRNALLRFHEEGVHPDYRIYLLCLFSALEPSPLNCAIYPLLTSYSSPDKQAFPRHSLSRAALMTSGSPIFFLDVFTSLIVFYSSTADPALPFPPPQNCLLRNTISKLKQERSITPRLIFIRGGQDESTEFENCLIEEQYIGGSGFTSVLGFVSFLKEINQGVVEYMK